MPDRVPCVPLVDTSYAAACAKLPVSECFLNPEAYAAALVATFDRHPGIDGVSINIGLCDEVVVDRTFCNGAHRLRTVGGLTWMVPENDIGSVESCEITDFRDPRITTVDYLMQACLRTLRAIPESYRKKYLINTTVTGPFSQVAFLVGLDRIMVATIEEEDALLRAIEARVPFALKWVDALQELDPGSIWIGEGFASNSLLSRASYRKFVMPFEKRVVDRIHGIGRTALLHICGKLDQSLESTLETGADGAEIDWQVAIPRAKRRVGERLTLKGNLNTATLVRAQPDEVYGLTREMIAQGKSGGRFIVSSGCCLGRDTPPENVDAMVRACEDCGAYP
jgi:uroporphyrinogen-III decarboxylase